VRVIGLFLTALVLVCCGSGVPPTARGVFGLKEYATATLTDGRILVLGGRRSGEGKVAEAMLCEPSSRRWTGAKSISAARVGHSATTLADGRVLVVGGTSDTLFRSGALAAAELFDPATGKWSAAASMPGPHTRHVAVTLPDGRVLIIGGRAGEGSQDDYLATVDAYDTQADRWQRLAPLGEPRERHVAVVLDDGRVFVAGGRAVTVTQWAETAELYDPRTDRWQRVASPLKKRHVDARGYLLADGRVAILDGSATEIYDPVLDRWEVATDTSSLPLARAALPCQ
jgi:N-acetylneuraminic acid mutarotase